MPLSVRIVLGSLLVLSGLTLLVVAALGLRRRLPRNRWVGVRTAATMRSNAAFTVANQVAAAPMAAAGAVATAGGATLLARADGGLAWALLAVSLVGATVLAGLGGVAGDRAASMVQPAPLTPSPCAGTCPGCDLVAGCRTAAAAAGSSGDGDTGS